ncbi:MAG: DNA helicase RecQ [Candidatus Magasanikbacteria bacterium]
MAIKKAKQALSKYFGYESFLSKQKEIIEAVLGGKDSLVLMPTGGGKSICFQIPGIIQPGICIVVSPLISLMRDQVDALVEKDIQAAYLNSSISKKEQQVIKQEARAGELDILYTSPERLNSSRFFNFLENLNINLFAIDEAHCISAWGHDFRPEYTNLKKIKKYFSKPIIALTATADEQTRKDIIKQLGLSVSNTEIFKTSFDRPNLNLQILSSQKKLIRIKKYINNKGDASGIVYCLSRKSTERVAKKLRGWGIDAKHYHAGLDSSTRDKRQREFIYDQTQVICATIAFGMGIDKSNIRFVIHYNLPKNIESYYQQIGRAGRDGADSDAILFYDKEDLGKLKFFAKQSDREEVQLAKLNHIRKFVENDVCRRKTLLAYFGEMYQGLCNNCDVCAQDPSILKEDEAVKKVLSALARLKKHVSIENLASVLIGEYKYVISSKGFDDIKTFGLGDDKTKEEWKNYINQLINLGLIKFSFLDSNKVEITKLGKKVLVEDISIELFEHGIKSDQASSKNKKTGQFKEGYLSGDYGIEESDQEKDNLYFKLKKLRKKLAKKQDVPPYVIYHDSTLEQIVSETPLNFKQLRQVEGIGSKKCNKYGEEIINTIIKYISKNPDDFDNKKVVYCKHYLDENISEISKSLCLETKKIYRIFEKLSRSGYNINLTKFVDKNTVSSIKEYIEEKEEAVGAEEVRQHISRNLPKEKVNFILTHIDR